MKKITKNSPLRATALVAAISLAVLLPLVISQSRRGTAAQPCDNGDGLVAQWGFEESPLTDPTALDTAGGTTLHPATLSAGSPVVAVRVAPGAPSGSSPGQGLKLDTSGGIDFASTPDESCLDISGPMTLSTWIRPSGIAATQNVLKKAITTTTGVPANNGYELLLASGGFVSFRVNQQASADTFRVNSGIPYPVSNSAWMHIAGVYDGTTMRIYINGVEDLTGAGVFTSGRAGPASILTNALPLRIGTDSNVGTPASGFNGQLDDTRVYNRALTACEINAVAGGTGCGTATPTNTAGPPTDTPSPTNTTTNTPTATPTNTPIPCDSGDGLVGLWGFEEASGPALDAAGSPNDATLLGGATRGAGVVGTQALSLPGLTGDYARAADADCLDITGNITLAGWVQIGRTTTTDLIKKAENTVSDGYELSLSAAGAAADQKVFLRLNQRSSGDVYRVNSSHMYPADLTWIHVAGTYDGAALRIYINGILDGTTPGVTTIAANPLPLGIGAQPDATGTRSLKGQMDDVRIYNRALTACGDRRARR